MNTVTTCSACGGLAAQIVAALDDESRERFRLFSDLKYGGLLSDWLLTVPPVVMQCDGCGHCWYRHQPDPNELGSMYAAGRPLGGTAKTVLEPSSAMLQKMTVLRSMLGRRLGKPALLDYGSGSGRWARAAMRAGFEVTAFEPSAVRSHSDDVPFALVHDLALLRGQRFAAIQLEQVLEHVPDPMAVLVDLKAYCEPDVLLRITVPNILRSPEGSALWDLWPFDGTTPHTLAPFEHLHGFTPNSLDRLLSRAGYCNADSLVEWRWQPVNRLRGLAGRWIPSMATTLRFATCR